MVSRPVGIRRIFRGHCHLKSVGKEGSGISPEALRRDGGLEVKGKLCC